MTREIFMNKRILVLLCSLGLNVSSYAKVWECTPDAVALIKYDPASKEWVPTTAENAGKFIIATPSETKKSAGIMYETGGSTTDLLRRNMDCKENPDYKFSNALYCEQLGLSLVLDQFHMTYSLANPTYYSKDTVPEEEYPPHVEVGKCTRIK